MKIFTVTTDDCNGLKSVLESLEWLQHAGETMNAEEIMEYLEGPTELLSKTLATIKTDTH